MDILTAKNHLVSLNNMLTIKPVKKVVFALRRILMLVKTNVL